MEHMCEPHDRGRRHLSGSWAASRPAPSAAGITAAAAASAVAATAPLTPLAARREPSDRRAGAPLDPSVVAAGVRGIIALQAAPAPPRQLVRLRTQAGRQDSQQAGQVDVGEAQQSHNQRGR